MIVVVNSMGIPSELAPSRLGDKVDFELAIHKLGHTSLAFEIKGSCDGEARLCAVITVVWMENWHAHSWSEETRKRLREFSEKTA